jgi:hypothetical protein
VITEETRAIVRTAADGVKGATDHPIQVGEIATRTAAQEATGHTGVMIPDNVEDTQEKIPALVEVFKSPEGSEENHNALAANTHPEAGELIRAIFVRNTPHHLIQLQKAQFV